MRESVPGSIKRFHGGMNKLIPPEETFRIALRRMQAMPKPILEGYFEIRKPSRMPQFRFVGTRHFQEMTAAAGTNGKGHTRPQALASGIMELAERYSCFKFLRGSGNGVYAPFGDMKTNALQWPDIRKSMVDCRQDSQAARNALSRIPVKWYKAKTLDGGHVYVPFNLLVFLLEGTNGMAAGNSLYEALLQGICEVIERHCVTSIALHKREVAGIALGSVTDPTVKALIARYRALGQEVFVRDFSLGLGIPVIGLIRRIKNDGYIVTAGAATDVSEALVRALTENSQGDTDPDNIVPFNRIRHLFRCEQETDINRCASLSDKDLTVELRRVGGVLNKQGMRIFFADTTDKALGLPSVMVFVSGAKFFKPALAYRNLSMAFVEERFQRGQYRQALEDIRAFQKKDTKNSLVYQHYAGITERALGRYSEAVRMLRRAAARMAVTRRFPDIRIIGAMHLGLSYCALGDTGKALACFEKVLAMNPEFRIQFLPLYYSTLNSRLRSLRAKRKLLRQAHRIFESVRQLAAYRISKNSGSKKPVSRRTKGRSIR